MLTCARDLAVGDVLGMATGNCAVVALYASHGGVEAVVEPAAKKSEAAGTRVLWFWRQEGVRRLRASGRAPETLRARPPKGKAKVRA